VRRGDPVDLFEIPADIELAAVLGGTLDHAIGTGQAEVG